MSTPNVTVEIHINGNDITRLYIIPEVSGIRNRMTFTSKESKFLVEYFKVITKRNLVLFTSRFGKDGIGLGSLGIKGLEHL